MAIPPLAEALVRWQHAAGPFWPYVCAAPFLGTGDAEPLARQVSGRLRHAPDHRSPEPARHPVRRPSRAATSLATRLLSTTDTPQAPPELALSHPADTSGLSLSRAREMMSAKPIFAPRSGSARPIVAPRSGARGEGSIVLLADLPPEPLLAAAPCLVERGWYVVPVIQRWIASPAVLPCRRLVERLLAGAIHARRPSTPRGAILIADGDRRGSEGYPATVSGRAFDNRYEYQICRFPSTDFLEAQGVARVHWVSNGSRAGERPVRPDLAPYLEDLLRAGLAVDVLPWQP